VTTLSVYAAMCLGVALLIVLEALRPST